MAIDIVRQQFVSALGGPLPAAVGTFLYNTLAASSARRIFSGVAGRS